MSDIKVRWEGISELKAALNKAAATKVASQVVKKYGAVLQSKAISNMNSAYRKGYSTGNTARSTSLQLTDGGNTATVAPNTKYFPYVEFGTRFMSAEPTLKPAFDTVVPRFTSELQNRLKDVL